MSGPGLPRAPQVHIVTLGCAKNVADTDLLAGQLLRSGCEIVPTAGEADAIVVNTCAFLASSQKESVNAILDLASLKEERGEENPLRLVVAGCLSQRHGAELLREIPEIDLLVGPGEVHSIATQLERMVRFGPNGDGRVRLGGMESVEERWDIRVVSGSRHSAYVKVSEGCDRACSFCVIPRLRGKNRSRTRESILNEVRALAGAGVREINLVAQELTAYGVDIYGRSTLADLLRDLSDCEGIDWIRTLYAYPSNWDDGLIHAYRDLPRVCRYIDMPIQHVSENVLREMRRPGGARTRRLLDRLRSEIPGLALRTTLITGFPGESELDFEELLSFVRDFRFDHLGVFAFSPEEGTPAASMEAQVPPRLRRERRARLLAAQREVSIERNRSRIGSEVRVMIDSLGHGRLLIGRHAQQAPEVDGITRIRATGGSGFSPGDMIDAVVTAAGVYDLVARPANRRKAG